MSRSNLRCKNAQGGDSEASYTIRGRMEACLWGDVAPVTLPFNKHTGAQLSLINSCPHTTCTHMQPEIMEVCTCTQPALSLVCSVCVCRGQHCVSAPSFPSLSLTHMEIKSTSFWEAGDKRDVGWRMSFREEKKMLLDACAKSLM